MQTKNNTNEHSRDIQSQWWVDLKQAQAKAVAIHIIRRAAFRFLANGDSKLACQATTAAVIVWVGGWERGNNNQRHHAVREFPSLQWKGTLLAGASYSVTGS